MAVTAAPHDDGTKPVEKRHALDIARLTDWLGGHVAGFRGPIDLRQFTGGQSNPTYKIVTPARNYVLRRKPPGKLLPSAHAVDREYRVIAALAGSGVPVARAHGLCEDPNVIGTAFYVMDCVDGRIFWDQRLPGLDPAERSAIYDEMNHVIAALHGVDAAAVGLGDYGRPGNYFARQIDRWTKQYRASETDHIPEMEKLIAWLPGHIPAGDDVGIVHGDFRLDNMIFHPTEPRVLAVLDWELSTLGHPLGDFAYHLMSWRFSNALLQGIAGDDLTALGIPDEQAYVAAYCRRTGRDRIDHLGFYLAFNMFRLAGILQGIMGRVLDGTATSDFARTQGMKARPVAELGWQIAVAEAGAAA